LACSETESTLCTSQLIESDNYIAEVIQAHCISPVGALSLTLLAERREGHLAYES